jgi:hypothetical protein
MSKIQSIVFNKNYFTFRTAQKWMVDHKFRLISVEETPNWYRFRQIDPSFTKRYRIKKIDKGIEIVLEI